MCNAYQHALFCCKVAVAAQVLRNLTAPAASGGVHTGVGLQAAAILHGCPLGAVCSMHSHMLQIFE